MFLSPLAVCETISACSLAKLAISSLVILEVSITDPGFKTPDALETSEAAAETASDTFVSAEAV